MPRIIFLFFAMLSMSMFSCSDSPMEEIKPLDPIAKRMDNFSRTKEALSVWDNTINSKLQAMREAENKMLENLATVKPDASDAGEITIAKRAFGELEVKRNDLRKLYEVAMQLFEIDENNFNDFKSKVAEGSITEDQIKRELIFYDAHIDSYDNNMLQWKSVLWEIENGSQSNQKRLERVIARSAK